MGRELPLHVYLRRGKYLYVEKSGYRPVRLYEQPGTEAFDREYEAATAHLPARKPKRQYIKPEPPARVEGPTKETLTRLLRYEPETGEITLPDGWPAFRRVGKSGYLVGYLLGRQYPAHRVIWAMVHDEWPETIDHINGDKTDNRLANLRSATALDQSRNRKLMASNKTGHSGIREERSGRWRAQIGGGGETIYLGTFATKAEAIAARKGAERALGYHQNHGREQERNVSGTSEPTSEQLYRIEELWR
jgi:hypothetical protein